MSKGKHTPGPWRVDRNRTIRTVADGSSNLVAEVHNCPYDTPTSDANARFIVRACNSHDELVEALEAMLGCYEGVYDMAVPTKHQSDEAKRAEGLARAALAKARGEA